MSCLNVAIVGAGWMGRTHAKALDSMGDSVAVVVDPDLTRAQAIANQFGGQAATSIEAIEGVDAAILATPTVLHLQQATRVVGMGIPVLVEKPHRLPGEDPQSLRNAAQSTNVRCQIGMTTRFHKGISATHTAIRRGQLGRIVSLSDRIFFQLEEQTLDQWYFDPSVSGGGVLLTNGVHAIDRATWLLGERLQVVDVSLHSIIPGHAVEDQASVRCRGEASGTPVDVSLLWSDFPVRSSELLVIGTDGMAHVGDDDWAVVTRSGSTEGGSPSPSSAFELQWMDFATCVRNPGVTGVGPDFNELEPALQLIEIAYQLALKDDHHD